MSETKLGQIYAVCAFLIWGAIAPIYFKQVADVNPLEVLMHRVIWSFVILIPLLFLNNQIKILKDLLKDSQKLKFLFLSTIFVSLNWIIFIWAVANGKIMETALGYYINPLVNVLLGFLFFSERMTKSQNIAIFIAFLAVVYQIITLGEIPIISLVLAFSFAFYGMIRKKINVGSLVGLFVETLMLMPFALVFLYYIISNNSISFLNDSSYVSLMLSLGGVITIVPLLLFNGAATRMKLTTLGFFQYIGPTCAFFLAVFVYDEELSINKMISFILIWIALLIFSSDSILRRKKLTNN